MDVATSIVLVAIVLAVIGLAAAAAAAAADVLVIPSSLLQSTVSVFFALFEITVIADK